MSATVGMYFIRKNKLNIRSKDHSIPQYLVNMGEIREKDIRHHPDRNKLLRVMGSEWESPRHQCIELPQLVDKDAFFALFRRILGVDRREGNAALPSQFF